MRTANRVLWAVSLGLLAYAYLWRIGRNPWSAFCDELLIGVRARQVLDGQSLPGPNAAFMDHFGTVAGALSAYAVVPFFALFGATDTALRLSTAAIMLATLAVLRTILRRMDVRGSDLAVLLFATSPIVIHLSRVTFGHAISLFCLVLGYAIYLRSGPRSMLVLAPLGGAIAGCAAYGYTGFYVAVPVIAGLIWIGGLWLPPTPSRVASSLFALGAYLAYLPVIDQMRNNPAFFARFEAKDATGGDLFSWARIDHVVANYPKYLDFFYWFVDGETGWPRSWIQRHSVTNAGLLSIVAIPVLVAAIVGIVRYRRTQAVRIALPFLLLVPLLPTPDILSTADDAPPYAFALFTGALALPFLAAFGIAVLIETGQRWRQLRLLLSPIAIHVLILATAIVFVFHTYARYPEVSSGYWGWQAGPREMIAYYIDHADEYDQFLLDPDRNEPGIYLDFYIDDAALRSRAVVGEVDRFDPARRQLFGIRRAKWEDVPDKQNWTVLEVIDIPGEPGAYLMVTHR
jgi:hypothetical protein